MRQSAAHFRSILSSVNVTRIFHAIPLSQASKIEGASDGHSLVKGNNDSDKAKHDSRILTKQPQETAAKQKFRKKLAESF